MESNFSNFSTVSNGIRQGHPALWLISIAFGSFGWFGLFSNSLFGIFLLCQFKQLKPYEIIFLAISMVDLSFSICNICQSFVLWHTKSLGCAFAGFFQYSLGYLSTMMPSLVVINRYLSMYNQQLFQKVFTRKKAAAMCICMSAILLLEVSPYLITGTAGSDALGFCGAHFPNAYYRMWYVNISAQGTFTFFISMFGLYKAYQFIGVQKRRQGSEGEINHNSNKNDPPNRNLHPQYISQQLADQITTTVTATNQVVGSSHRFQSKLLNESKQILRLMVIVEMLPIFTCMPGSAMALLLGSGVKVDPWVVGVFTMWYPCVSAFYPVLTMLLIKSYRKSLAGWFQKKGAKVGVSNNSATNGNNKNATTTNQ